MFHKLRASTAWQRIRTLGGAPREMWVTTVVVRIMLAFTYFTLASFFVAHVEFEYGYTDSQSTKLFGVWGCMISFFSLLTGPLIDYVGVRKAIVVGALLLVVGLTMFAFAFTSGWLFIVAVFVLVPAGIALGLPVCDVGSKQYSYAKNSNVVFSLAYSMNNVGAALGSLALFFLVLEFGRLASVIEPLQHTSTTFVPPAWTPVPMNTSSSSTMMMIDESISIHNHRFSPQRIMLFVCALVTATAGLVAALTIGDVFVNDHGEVESKSMPAGAASAAAPPPPSPQQQQQQPPAVMHIYAHETIIHRPPPDRWHVRASWNRFLHWLRNDLAALPYDATFRRLFVCVFVSLFTRHVFQQLNTTLPLYLYRVFGRDAPVNAFYAINPTIVSVLAPVMSLVTAAFDPYRVIICGSFVASASLMIFVFFTPTYTSVALALTLFSIGESIYSPALTRYVLVLSPAGYEGQYSALTSAPIFLGKVFVAIISGDLLEAECPRDGSNANCGNVWLTISLVSFITPVALVLLTPYIHNHQVKMRLARLNRAAMSEDAAEAAGGDDERFEDHDNDLPNRSSGGTTVYRSAALDTIVGGAGESVANELRGGL